MKELVREVVEPKKVIEYIADDGTPFTDRRSCLQYERAKLLEKVEAEVQCCSEIDNYANFDGCENMEAHQYKWYYPKSIEQIELLQQAYGTDKILDSHVNEWICVEYEDDGDFVWVSKLSDSIQYAKSLLKALGYSISIRKKNAA